MRVFINEYEKMTGYEHTNIFKVFYNALFNNQYKARVLAQKMQMAKNEIGKRYLRNRLIKKYNISIGMNTKIGENLSLQHVEIGGTILTGIIGNNCIIYHQVTLGNKNNQYPILGDNVTVYPGAKIIGNVKIGNNVIVGTNAVVLHDVPSDSVVAGVPARIINT